jgi:hypothetical protein
MFVLNIENSPVRNRLYRVFLINGDHIDIGDMKSFYYTDHNDEKRREKYFNKLTNSQIEELQSLKPSRLLYEFFLLNGFSKDIIKNINFYNKHFSEY